MLSKAGGNTTVRAPMRARVRVRIVASVCACVVVQFYGNADPQNKVTNEFAAPVLARSALVLRGTLAVPQGVL